MSTPPRFETRDPAQAAFWTERYAREFMPWDQRDVPTDLVQEVRAAATGEGLLPRAPARVLLPGCGSGYELRLLAELGYDALAIDISSAAVERARAQVGPHAERVQLADCFEIDSDARHAGQYAWIYERAFVCALPPRLWTRWAQAMTALTQTGGVLAGYFYFDADKAVVAPDARRGPPFAMRADELSALLSPHFACVADREVRPEHSVDVFRGKERWMVWRRLG